MDRNPFAGRNPEQASVAHSMRKFSPWHTEMRYKLISQILPLFLWVISCEPITARSKERRALNQLVRGAIVTFCATSRAVLKRSGQSL